MSARLLPTSPLASVPGIGLVYRNKLNSLGIFTIRDLLFYFPFRYEDLSDTRRIVNLTQGQTVTITAQVWQITKIRTRTGKTLVKAVLNDSTGSIEAVWFNQEYLMSVLKINQVFNFSGKVSIFNRKLTFLNPKFEAFSQGKEAVHTARLIPIYSESGGVSSRWIRSKINLILKDTNLDFQEDLPAEVLKAEHLIDSKSAFQEIHFPTTSEKLGKSRERFAFEELFFLRIRNQLTKPKEIAFRRGWKFDKTIIDEFSSLLSFELTVSQKKAITEISSDLRGQNPMNRLLQGEVGSGKTIVSAFALFCAVKNGFQGALMAPTEILAKQHFNTLESIFKNKLSLKLVTSTSKLKELNFDLAVGTHALLGKTVNFSNLGLIVVDEQQRFGVNQRQLLREKGKKAHFLTMTATPIPRTLALTIYGKLDISTLEELPFGRKKVRTYLVPQIKRKRAYEFIQKEVLKGGQAFVVCPLINTSESLLSVKSATEEYERLSKEVFPHLKIALLHGKLKSSEKDEAIKQFRDKKIQILVTTPVVEVGIDIPEANIIIIEAAERFGLASLHQLRGRVGRVGQESFCLLFTQTTSERTLERLKYLEKYTNGLDLAELDMKMRGPGDVFGTLQHGQIDLKTADFLNLELIERSRAAADLALEKKLLTNPTQLVRTWFPEKSNSSND